MTEQPLPNSVALTSDNITNVRIQIVDSILLLGTLLGLIYLGLFLFTTPFELWLFSDVIFLGIILAWGSITLFKNKIHYTFKAMIIIGLMYVTAVFNVVGWGLIGSNSVWLILVVLMSITLFSRHAGLIAYAVVVATVAIIALLVRLDILVFSVDFEAYAISDARWLSRSILIILICAMIVASVGRVLDILSQQLREFQQNSDELAQRQTELSDEVQKRQTTELALADAVTHLKDLDRLKNNFIDSVSHELRTPLANIQLYHQLLAMNPNKAKDYLETLKVETERLNHIVEQMIHASSDEYNMQLSTMIEVELGDIIQRLFDEHTETLTRRKLRLQLPLIDRPYLTLAAPEHIYRAVGNLVDNAVKYTPENGNIIVSMFANENTQPPIVGLSISNTGNCPSEHEKTQMFERFVRGKSSLELGVAGAGLGLPISKQILEKYNGFIRLKYEDEMLSFTIGLPAINTVSSSTS